MSIIDAIMGGIIVAVCVAVAALVLHKFYRPHPEAGALEISVGKTVVFIAAATVAAGLLLSLLKWAEWL